MAIGCETQNLITTPQRRWLNFSDFADNLIFLAILIISINASERNADNYVSPISIKNLKTRELERNFIHKEIIQN